MFFQVESAENFSKFCLKGYAAKMAEKKILCMPCCKALGSVNHQAESIFLKLKDRGSLFKPTQSVITICEETGKCFEQCFSLIAAIYLKPLLQLCYLESASQGFLHVFSLIKTVPKCYCKVRFYHFGKEATTKVYEKNVRKTLTKLVLFNDQ